MFPREETIKLLTDITAIDSTNSWLIPGSPDEREVQRYFAAYLKALGIDSHFEDINGTQSNLVATIKGAGGGKNITLYAHADTVGYELWKDRALTARLEGDRMVGLGIADDKGHCAAILQTAKALVQSGAKLAGDVTLLFCADEEGVSCGAFAYAEKHTPEACIVLESAPIQHINITQQGFGWLKLRVGGKAGHGSAGVASADAITRMAEVIVRMDRTRREKFAPNPHPLNGETVYHTGTIRGGTDFATYPDACELGIEIGTQPGETIADRVAEIEAAFDEVRVLYPDLDASVEVVIERFPFITKGTDELFALLAASIKKVTGQEAAGVGENAWGDAQIFQDAGFPTLGFGALGGNFHAPEEWISLPEFDQLVDVLTDLVQNYCV